MNPDREHLKEIILPCGARASVAEDCPEHVLKALNELAILAQKQEIADNKLNLNKPNLLKTMKTSTFLEWIFHLFGGMLIFTTLSYSLNYTYMPVLDTDLTRYWNEINLLSFIAFLGMLANSESNRDSKRIADRLTINHWRGVWRRGWWIFGAVFLFKLPWFELAGGAALFSILFNLLLNSRRGKPWDYISDSNNYDRFFRKLFGVKNGGLIKFIFEGTVAQLITIQWLLS